METARRYEIYPTGIVLASNFISIAIYALGLLIIYNVGIVFTALYLVFILAMEFRLISMHCTNCYYWGKTCAFGKGRLSARIFKKGNTAKFCNRKITWWYMIPDMLISLVPLVIGIVLLIISFNLILLSALLVLIVLTTFGNSFIRGSLACNHCKQKDLGCPAYELFNSKSQPASTN